METCDENNGSIKYWINLPKEQVIKLAENRPFSNFVKFPTEISMSNSKPELFFEDYYFDVYLPKHRHPLTKLCHMLGTLLTFLCALASAAWWWPGLLLSPLVVYPFAWLSHLLVEGNKPAAFKNPIWARLSDWRMCIDVVSGTIPLDTRLVRNGR